MEKFKKQICAKNATFKTLGASNHTKNEREMFDFYATEPKATNLLLDFETFNNVLEPACGLGHIANVLKKRNVIVTCTDLVDRGYGTVKNFFDYKEWNGDIVTNPPYKYALEFVQHALKIIPEGNKVAMFLKLLFLEGKKRKKFFLSNPPKTVYVSSSRLICAKNGDFETMKKNGGSAIAYAWFVWVKGYKNLPRIIWCN